jgi:glycosyltransferase involved in cell wall biosynthesis
LASALVDRYGFQIERGYVVPELISVVVSTYNRPDALHAVLRGLSRQTDRAFEVIVADDGSPPSTAAVVTDWAARIGVSLGHVWHEHREFRAPEISNRAVLASRGDYLVFLDGDCIPRPTFLAAHRSLAEPGWFVFGNRTLMSRQLTECALRDDLEPEFWSFGEFVRQRRHHTISRLLPVVRLPLGPLRKLNSSAWRNVRTCNLGIWRSDFEHINGQEATYRGWSPHDNDMAVRLIRAGRRRKDGRFRTGVLHLWHPDSDRARLAENLAIFRETLASNRIRAVQGLDEMRNSTAAGKPQSMPAL